MSDFVLQRYRNQETKKIKKFSSLFTSCKTLVFSDKIFGLFKEKEMFKEFIFIFAEIFRNMFSDEYFMKTALQEARYALEEEEVPIGCVIVCNNKIIARGHNLTERLNDITAHAEMQSITSAANFLGGKYLKDCTMYVTLEPCVMCAGALFWSQISRLVIGARDEKRGFLNKGIELHPKTEIITGVLEEECSLLVSEFFKGKR